MSRPHLAYVIYWGATEPLGRAVALPPVEAFTRRFDVTLLSFEKEADLEEEARLQDVRGRLEAAGVGWIPLRYHKRPPVISSFWDAWRGWRALVRAHRRHPFDVVEARTFVAGLIGARAAPALDVPLVYYMDACWPDEQVDAGHWREGSLRHRVARALESRTLERASGLVVLTEEAKDRLAREGRIEGRPVTVAPPTSRLVERAGPDDVRESREPSDGLRLIYLGSVTGRYRLGAMLDFVRAAREERPGTTLSVLARRDRHRVRRAAGKRGLGDVVTVRGVEHDEVPGELRRADAGLFFLAPGLSEPCVSPTKVGEYLAYGLPVVSTRASGDAAGVIESARAGVVLDDDSPGAYRAAAARLSGLVADPELPGRAHRAATEHYGLRRAMEGQIRVFETVLGRAIP